VDVVSCCKGQRRCPGVGLKIVDVKMLIVIE
jgi:hypothetical protein